MNRNEPLNQVYFVTNFHDLISIPFSGEVNAACWKRELKGDFAEIVHQVKGDDNIVVLEPEDLWEMELSEQGQYAREVLLADMKLLKDKGTAPILNLIRYYERDEDSTFFPTDVYSFHVDRAPIPTSTFLCTYYGESSEIIPNAHAEQKILVPHIRDELKKNFSGTETEFESYLQECFFDLHYQAKPHANIISLGLGNVWRLAVDCPGSSILPCIHRAPIEKEGQPRLLLIC